MAVRVRRRTDGQEEHEMKRNYLLIAAGLLGLTMVLMALARDWL
jgi:hypothetical protein